MYFDTNDNASIHYFVFSKRKNIFALYHENVRWTDITFCLEERMHYLINGEHIYVEPGDAIIIPSGTTYERFFNPNPAYYASINILLDKEWDYPIHGVLKGCVNSEIIELLGKLKNDYFTPSARSNEKCLSTLLYICNLLEEKTIDHESYRIRLIKQYISKNISKTITLDKIAGVVHIAPQYVCNLFKKETGMTLTEYINRERISIAKRMFPVEGVPLYQISKECGFKDYNHFSHTFKKIVGVSPAEYKRAKQSSNTQ